MSNGRREQLKQWLVRFKREASASSETQRAKQQQFRLGALLVGGLLFVLIGFYVYSSRHNASDAEPSSRSADKPAVLASPLKDFDAQSLWVETAQQDLSEQTKLTAHLNQLTHHAVKQQQHLQQQSDAQQAVMNHMRSKLESLEAELQASRHQREQNAPKGMDKHAAAVQEELPDDMQHYTLQLTPQPVSHNPLPKTPQYYVPLGSHVTTVLVGGADVSAAVTASSTPRVIYMRTRGRVRLPGNKTAPLKNCYLLGSSWGDVSSERIYVRLVSMSCERDGQSIEYHVKGNVFGPDGRLGIRGKVVMRDAALVSRAFAGGLLSGLGDVTSESYTNTSTSPLGTVKSVEDGSALRYGLGKGMKKAADMYADYNIKRAEQYQPVIEVSAGTVADVVFAKGFYLSGDKSTHQTNAPPQLIQASSTLVPLMNQATPLTTNQMGQAFVPTKHPSQFETTFP